MHKYVYRCNEELAPCCVTPLCSCALSSSGTLAGYAQTDYTHVSCIHMLVKMMYAYLEIRSTRYHTTYTDNTRTLKKGIPMQAKRTPIELQRAGMRASMRACTGACVRAIACARMPTSATTRKCTCAHAHASVSVHSCLQARARACTCTCVRMGVRGHARVCMQTCTYACAHTQACVHA
jgi:hypothetical protein